MTDQQQSQYNKTHLKKSYKSNIKYTMEKEMNDKNILIQSSES